MDSRVPYSSTSSTVLFSVLIATYNQSEWIEVTLDSVAAQTWRDWELVVVNDGSTDDTAERVSAWMARYSKVDPTRRLVLETIVNSGQSAALERGFAACRGCYIALLDSDDLWAPQKLQRMAEATSANPAAGIIMHKMFVIDPQGRRTGDIRPKRACLPEGDQCRNVRETARTVIPATSAIVIRSDVFRNLLPMPTKTFRSHADAYLGLGALLHSPAHAVNEPLAEYRMHPQGAHFRAMLSPDGLKEFIRLHDVMFGRLGLTSAAVNNSYYLRHVFALAKFEGSLLDQWTAFSRLTRATLHDHAFHIGERLKLLCYWIVCALAPRSLFSILWRAFQIAQTGSRGSIVRDAARSESPHCLS